MSRGPSPAPPLPPPKDASISSSSTSARSSLNNRATIHGAPSSSSRLTPDSLAEAVRDSVRISPSNTSLRNTAIREEEDSHSPLFDFSQPRRTPPLPPLHSHAAINPKGSRESIHFHPSHAYSSSTPEMAFQPQLPSQAMAARNVQNPFEMDEIEPAGTGKLRPPGSSRVTGLTAAEAAAAVPVQPARQKFVRAQTGTTATTSPTKTRPRRSMSSDSYGLDTSAITSGQKKAAEDKKGSRHADVVDAWDPTGLGSAMWHHSGPYDAAAPSRNNNLPNSKAPMQAFRAPPITSPPRTGPTTISLSSPPPVPGKSPAGEHPETGARPIKKGQAAMREKHTQSRRISGGGLTGQYSTSMPASGGYFPDMDAMEDEAAIARKERQRERESKRRALKAAWGIDTPEPFEDFGQSPGETGESPDEYLDAQSPPLRSPGFRLGVTGQRSPGGEPTSPTAEYGPGAYHRSNSNSAPGAQPGVKRTKSLMQKIKTMRDNANGNKAARNAPSPRNSPGIETAPPVPTIPSDISPNGRRLFRSAAQTTNGRVSPSKLPAQPAGLSDEGVEESGIVRGDSSPDDISPAPSEGFILVESPSSKARAAAGKKGSRPPPPPPGGKRTSSPSPNMTSSADAPFDDQSQEVLDDGTASRSATGAKARPNRADVPVNRVKGLPTPPVGPVMPDFGDLVISRSGSLRRSGANSPSFAPDVQPQQSGGGTVKRKTSMVKKLKDRMAK